MIINSKLKEVKKEQEFFISNIPIISPLKERIIPEQKIKPVTVEFVRRPIMKAPPGIKMGMPAEFNPRIQQQTMPEVQPTAQPIPAEFSPGKIKQFIDDSRVGMIECQGPGKLILLRIFGKSTVSNISLTEEEIKSIIQEFSKVSKIPVLGGLFKVAVGNLLITAVISDLVGSRFVITKIMPQMQMPTY